ncbi:MAG: hypothetical protein CMJ18_26425 [Phycisphaeraceae bacterium]|nr:hypothetical protein [Phycisphaeraceae bacterium]
MMTLSDISSRVRLRSHVPARIGRLPATTERPRVSVVATRHGPRSHGTCRMHLIRRVRAEIATGLCDAPGRIDATVDALLDRLRPAPP